MRIVSQNKQLSKNHNRLPSAGNHRDYRSRLKSGHRFEDTVIQKFQEDYGITLHPYGLDREPKEARNNLIYLADPTSLLIRFLPDFYTIFYPISTQF